jgi:hypothetical protein
MLYKYINIIKYIIKLLTLSIILYTTIFFNISVHTNLIKKIDSAYWVIVNKIGEDGRFVIDGIG